MSDDWQRLRDRFERALELAGAARDEYLAGLPPDEAKRLRRILAADAAVPDALDGVALDLLYPPLAPGTRAGAWEVVSEIGRGGMGWVYRARRADGLYEQTVALKDIDPALADDELLARFAAERSILASLEHPAIARLLDAGLLPDGTPFLVLEHVEGLPIDRHCADQALDAAARLELVERVCAAVAFAHHRLVIHCDLKPGNVLISGEGEVKLLDFGIARLLGEGRRENPEAPSRRRLTPAFASPEQARGEALTTASDIYSLGAVLHSLLTGRPPDPAEPAPPGGSLDLPRSWRRDLDAILARALAEDPAERYPSVEALAEDLRRVRYGYPVSARAPTWHYRARRFARRHRLGTVATALALLVLSAGVWRVDQERQRAENERQKAGRVADFVTSLIRSANPGEDEAAALFSGDAAARAGRELLLDEGVRRARRELTGDPQVQSRLLFEIGDAYRQLGAAEKAGALFESALILRRQERPANDVAVAEVLLALCRLRLFEGELAAARERCREARTLASEATAGGSAMGEGGGRAVFAAAINELGLVQRAGGDLPGAARYFAAALRLRRELEPADPRAVETSLNNLALAHQESGDAAAAEGLLQEVLASRRSRLDADHLLIAHALNNLASVAQDLGRSGEAAALYREARDRAERSLGREHPFVATLHNNLGALALDQGAVEEARNHFKAALELGRQTRGEGHPEVAGFHHNLAVALHRSGELAAAEAHLATALDIRRQALGVGHPDFAASLFARVAVDLARGEVETAEGALLEARRSWRETPPKQTWVAGWVEAMLGRCHLARGDRPAARRSFERAAERLETAGHGPESAYRRAVAGLLEGVT
ncbi:MAG: serine/threonine-protein kinase [Acidobacteriota bacterium]